MFHQYHRCSKRCNKPSFNAAKHDTRAMFLRCCAAVVTASTWNARRSWLTLHNRWPKFDIGAGLEA